MKSIAWDFVSHLTSSVLDSEIHLCYWQTRILNFIDSAWQAMAMNRYSILAQSLIFLTFPEFCKINMLEGAYSKAKVLR